MKVTIICLALASFSFALVAGGPLSLETDKAEAIKNIDNKNTEFLAYIKTSEKEISEEEKKCNEFEGKIEEEKNTGKEEANDIKNNLKKTIMESIKIAIAKGKPLSTFECIQNVSIESNVILNNNVNEYESALKNTATQKSNVLNYAKREIEDITKVMDDLKGTFIENIKSGNTSALVEKHKKEGLQKFDNAKKVVADIEKRLRLPNLGDALKDMKEKKSKKFQEIESAMKKKLTRCVA